MLWYTVTGIPVLGTAPHLLDNSFDNEATFPDTIIRIIMNEAGEQDPREIQVHKHVVAAACEALATCWRQQDSSGGSWVDGKDIFVLWETTYESAWSFFRALYAGDLVIKVGDHSSEGVESQVHALLGVLALADQYMVAGLVREVEIQLAPLVSFGNVLKILSAASHHSAEMLEKHCIFLIRTCHWRPAFEGKPEFEQLGQRLQHSITSMAAV